MLGWCANTVQNGLSSNIFAVKEIKVDNKSDRQKVALHWASEVKAMAMMNTLDHKDHIVRFITAFRRGNPKDPEHYLVTEWADGGNLRNLWESIPKPPLTASFLKAVVKELLGLAQAFCAAHFLTSGGVYSGASYRHGDLKPANILWFQGGEFGKLKICDWGEAKNKQVVTAMRHSKTSAEFGTRRYEPPEVETGVSSMLPGQEEKRRSRLYDIWAMGCITLEFIVWLLYGLDGLQRFNKSVKGDLNDDSPFYQTSEKGGKKIARVHDVVTYWIGQLAQDPSCRAGTTALGDLLEIVHKGLLVVRLPKKGGTFSEHNFQQHHVQIHPTKPNKPGVEDARHQVFVGTSTFQAIPSAIIPSITVIPAEQDESDREPAFVVAGPERFRADQLRDRLEFIMTADEDDSYWSSQLERKIPDIPGDLYSTNSASEHLRRPHKSRVDYGHPKLDPTKWEFKVDNTFAAEVFSAYNGTTTFPLPNTKVSSNLCANCKSFRERVWNIIFSIKYDVQNLEAKAKAKECDLCELLWATCQRNWGVMFPEVSFERFGSFLTMNAGGPPVLSMSRSPSKLSLALSQFARKHLKLMLGSQIVEAEKRLRSRLDLLNCRRSEAQPTLKSFGNGSAIVMKTTNRAHVS